MSDNLEPLREAATWARALTWPLEVSDARLGKTATTFMELATPDAVLGLLKQIEGLHAAVNSECQDWAREYERSRRFAAELALVKAENETLRKASSGAAADLVKGAAWICREVEAGTKSAKHWAIRLGDNAKALDAAISMIEPVAQIRTAELVGPALAWAVRQPVTDQPKTFGCHHMMPTCRQCEGLVRSWLIKELGVTVSVPQEFLP